MKFKLKNLVAATHTPFKSDGSLNLPIVEQQAAQLLCDGVHTVFVGGSTGESHSLTLDERLNLVRRWSEVIKGTALKLVVHVGSNCLADARTMASHAQANGAVAISALSPSYFKPKNLDALIACCSDIAGAAPALPFYFYDIPVLTGVNFSMPEFLSIAPSRIPNLAGIKFTNPDLMAYQLCLRANDAMFDIPWGCDEYLLAALALGASGAVGSSYNFAAPVYNRVIKSFAAGNIDDARTDQFRSVKLIELLASFGYMSAAKAVMNIIGVNVGPARLPHTRLDEAQLSRLRSGLESIGYFSWGRS